MSGIVPPHISRRILLLAKADVLIEFADLLRARAEQYRDEARRLGEPPADDEPPRYTSRQKQDPPTV